MYADDIDILSLLLHYCRNTPDLKSIFITEMTRKSDYQRRKCYSIREVISQLSKRGEPKLSHLLFAHAFTGCDMTSAKSTYSWQKFSGLSWMVKRYYIQDYPENFRGNTKRRTIASDFIRTSIESSLTRRDKKRTSDRHVCGQGQVAFYKLLTWTRLENSNVGTKKIYIEAFDIIPCYMMNFLCYSCSQLWAR